MNAPAKPIMLETVRELPTASRAPIAHNESSIHWNRIGEVLVESKKIEPQDVDQILMLQRSRPEPFGFFAQDLELCSQADVEQALAAQQRARREVLKTSGISQKVAIAFSASGPYASAILDLRSFIQFNMRAQKSVGRGNTYGLVSPNRHDGRSTVLASLGVVFAQLGKRTLIVDADLRNPAQAQLFAIPASLPGLGELAQNLCTVPASINAISAVPGLFLLPAGKPVYNPHDLFARDGFSSLFDHLSQSFDVVLVDIPAFTGTPEASVIASHCQGTILLGRNGKTKSAMFEAMTAKLQAHRVNTIGAVFIN